MIESAGKYHSRQENISWCGQHAAHMIFLNFTLFKYVLQENTINEVVAWSVKKKGCGKSFGPQAV